MPVTAKYWHPQLLPKLYSAIILPFVELIAGLALIIGIYPRSAALIINAMLLVFIVSLTINIIRGHEFDCGCFAINAANPSTFSGELLIRDFLYLALGIFVFFFRNPRRVGVHIGRKIAILLFLHLGKN